ncbi:C4-dicarboxylate ABC transporter [Marinobacterium zhoushanense]|uniref:C4-dicarboxylate ABC transporter n=1 Tax=Marinobacterium zhoushanense TaxID=1679163 RepID=A0ABQ1KMK2_9GAMM|nr:TRAP transporter permease [Marinobacterium zhoushanense]GGC03872.1 C4-dicarboxylate ABC transporter [Marinobacterium zhoushanense]
MATDSTQDSASDSKVVEELLSSETGSRELSGVMGKLVIGLLIAWSVFQLWYASPLPFILHFGNLNADQAKFIHLAFASFLAFCLFPATKRSSHTSITPFDALFALGASISCLYLLVFRDELTQRIGAPSTLDVAIAIVGMLTLLEATRRALGPPLTVVAIVFLTFTFGGQYMPDVIAHKGASLNKVASHQWLTTEGVFGVALGVSTAFVFLFVLLGAMLDKAGAGNYLIKVSFSLLGHMRGGPAKAAVVASGLSGIISGSSIANVVTTGTFTIPLMKRVGFPATKACAVEVAASTNGQLTPPIMGAAAFLMVEYVGIPYIDVIKHAILPSMISYIALVYIVHLEAVKLGMQGITRLHKPTLPQRMLSWMTTTLITLLLAAIVYYGSTFLESSLGDWSYLVMLLVLVASYFALVKLSASYPDLVTDDASIELEHLPEARPTVFSGLYFGLPIVVLLWALAVKQYSPQQSAFYAVAALIAVVLTHRPLKSWFRGEHDWVSQFNVCWHDFVEGLISGARNMVGIGIATAAAGIIVGTVTLTGLGQMMTEFVEFISGGSLILILIFTAVICIILGMGLPTTANYIVVSTLMAPVIVSLGAANGLIVPLIAVHLFVFYFGILADDTPPVGLAAFAAAAIGRTDPIKTGIQGFTYDIRTAILPFMFIFNTQLLLIGLTGVFDLIVTVVSAIIAILVFSAATQGYWFVKSRLWESVVLVVIAFSLFRPGFWWDMVYPPSVTLPPAQIETQMEKLKAGDYIQINFEGMTIEGDEVSKTVQLQLDDDSGDATARLESLGLMLSQDDERRIVDLVVFGSAAERSGVDFGWELTGIQVKSDRPPKELVFIPVLLLLVFIGWLQRRRLAATATTV